jgi:hypothetical protein
MQRGSTFFLRESYSGENRISLELIVSKLIGGEGQVGRQVWRCTGPAGVAQPWIGTNQLVVRSGLWGTINFDWAAKDSPGNAGCGATLREWNPPHKLLASDSDHIGCQTNNVMEYGGLLLGLQQARSQGAVRVEVRGDSKLVLNQMGYGCACRKLPLIRLQRVARRLMHDFTAGVDFAWVSR